MSYRTIIAFFCFLAVTAGAAGSPFTSDAAALPEESTGEGVIEVTSDDSPFQFQAVDVYSSLTPIPYRFVGFLDSQVVFDVSGIEPNTFGDFATVENPYPAEFIDTLEITLTNPTLQNPMGLDNIIVSGETLDFEGLVHGSSFYIYSQDEFTVTSALGDWLVSATYGNPPPFIYFFNPDPVGGSVTGITPNWVRCRNMTTRRMIWIREPGISWNCEEEGLVFNPGDRVRMTVEGIAE